MLTLRALLLSLLLSPVAGLAQGADGWQACAAIADGPQRLACFDRWASGQRAPAAAAATAEETPPASVPPPVVTGPWRDLGLTALQGCRDVNYSDLARFWELEPGADCGTFGLRGYRPVSLSVVTADTINRLPTSANPRNNATEARDYRITETRLQLSVRTKLAGGILPLGPERSDSLWLAYTQQSYWQVFTPALSRPFRSTDHEPELIYVLPLQGAKDGAWRVRYGGLGLVHQSNGQSLPLSRSWNRVYLMAGAERGPLQVHARIWRRIDEGVNDDNPDISDHIGRAELRGSWQFDRDNRFVATLRHNLRKSSRGSLRLEWFRALGDETVPGGVQLHTQLFHGYGDSLLDYNRRRTVLGIGFSLVDW